MINFNISFNTRKYDIISDADEGRSAYYLYLELIHTNTLRTEKKIMNTLLKASFNKSIIIITIRPISYVF